MSSLGITQIQKKRKSLSLDTKLKVINMTESGKSKAEIRKELDLNEATIRTILRDAEKYRNLSTITTCTTQSLRNKVPIMVEMENHLFIWVQDCNRKRIPLSTLIIMNKAKEIFDHLKTTKYINAKETFAASRGWFAKFKCRFGLKNIKMSGEAASADTQAASAYPAELLKIILDQ